MFVENINKHLLVYMYASNLLVQITLPNYPCIRHTYAYDITRTCDTNCACEELHVPIVLSVLITLPKPVYTTNYPYLEHYRDCI